MLGQRLTIDSGNIVKILQRYGHAVTVGVALCASAVFFFARSDASAIFYLQFILLTHYLLQVAVTNAHFSLGSPGETPSADLAMEAARAFFRYRQARYIQGQRCLLFGALCMNALLILETPPNLATLLWMLSVPFLICSLISLRLVLLRIQVETGQCWDEHETRAISLFLIKRQRRNDVSGGRRSEIGRSELLADAKAILSTLGRPAC
jgi:hypothetical protein